MRQSARQASADSQLLFLPGVFNETMSLMHDAHQYFNTRGREEQESIEPDNRTVYAKEMSRVTLRLTSVMAWLMARRAIHAGRIAEGKIDDFQLGEQDFCLTHQTELLENMPYYLNYLSDRSLKLYERIKRLDDEAHGTKH